MLAGIESLIGLIIFVVISLLASWAQKKQRESTGEDIPVPRPPPRVPPQRVPPQRVPPPIKAPEEEQTTNWEEELKRLLEGRFPEPEPEPPAPPPLVTIPPAPRPPPPPEDFSETTYQTERNPVEVAFKPLAGLSESLKAYQRASNLEKSVEQRLQQATHSPVAPTRVEPRPINPAAQRARALLKGPESLRSAILVSVIFGPPRALTGRDVPPHFTA